MLHSYPDFVIIVLAAAMLGAGTPFCAQEPVPDSARIIEMTAQRYEFNPGEIRAKKGERVRLKIRALDRTHGLEFRLYPEGAGEEGEPGLHFADGQRRWRLEKDQERIIEFVAGRAGTYTFKCSVFCGWRHGRMRGSLIVEE